MDNVNILSNGLYEMKIYQLDLNHHRLKKHFGHHKKINEIIAFHCERIKVKFEEHFPIEIEGINYYSYLYREDEKDSYWTEFLPKELKQDLKFELDKLSYVLFASTENSVYAIIGGGGSRVIKTFQNQRFGIELFEHITEEDEQIVSITSRGISGTLTQSNFIYREGQRLSDTLDFANIPTKIVLTLSEFIKDNYFNFIEFDNRDVKLEVGSYFHIKHRITFLNLHLLFFRIDEILINRDRKYLTSFIQIVDKELIDSEYPKILMKELRDEMVNKFRPDTNNNNKFDIDFIHPSKIQQFYECDKFEIKLKGDNKQGVIIENRKELFDECLNFIYLKKGINVTQNDFNSIVWQLQVICHKGKRNFRAPFFKYVTCEIPYNGRPTFQIDANWYQVKDNFKEVINTAANKIFKENYITENILNEIWEKGVTEGEYNSRYKNKQDFYVFDKALGDNIEMCDIMYETDKRIYFIHVKSGFDAKMRDLANQVIISAKRFMISRDSGGLDFVKKVIKRYNSMGENIDYKIADEVDFLNKFKNKNKEIVYVMAFKSTSKRTPIIRNNIEKLESNIAKFSLIQCVKEMNTYNYPLEIIEISNH